LVSLYVVQTVHSFQPKSAHVHANAHTINRRLFVSSRLRPLAAVVVQENANEQPSPSNGTMSLQRPAATAPAKPEPKSIATGTQSQPSPSAQSPGPVRDFDTTLQFLEAASLPLSRDDDDDTDNNKMNNNNNHGNRILVVKYYANYCKICQRAGINYKKVAMEQQQQQQQQQQQARQTGVDQQHFVDFYQLDAGRLPSETLKQLGVTKFPYCQVFVGGDCVSSFGLGTGAAAHLLGQRVRDTIDICRARTPDEWQAFQRDFSVPIKDNRSARAAVKESLLQNAMMTESSSSSTDEHVLGNGHDRQ
jgi:hypothetical protein